MQYNEKTYSYTLELELPDDREVKKRFPTVSSYLAEYEKTKTETCASPPGKIQEAARFTENSAKPVILTGIKYIDLTDISLDRQIAEMLEWNKAVGYIMPLLEKMYKEADKIKKTIR